MRTIKTRCVVVGGGPAGMMTGYMLARAGVDVLVLEKHGDFLRDFRGDTIHPSTLEVLHELGVLDEFLKVPHHKTRQVGVEVGGRVFAVADFRSLPVQCGYIAFVPQWDFLDFLADRGRELPSFALEMNAEATELVFDQGRATGVRADTGSGVLTVEADLVIAADGRGSHMRAQSDLPQVDLGAPIDVLWMRVPRRVGDPPESMGAVGGGAFLAMIARGDYWQCGFVIPKGSAEQLRDEGLDAFRARLAEASPLFADRTGEVKSWDEVKLLSVSVDRLVEWSRPGLLCIGDAAHAMSPVGGIGINLAIQDAVATANILSEALRTGAPSEGLLKQVQSRRLFPTRVTQRLQVMAHRRILTPIIGSRGRRITAPLLLRLLDAVPVLRRIPARIIGLGVRPEHARADIYPSY